jgi:outer membrane lipoprotein SlyB
MKMKKSILAAALSAALLVSLTGCTSNDNKNGTVDNDSGSDTHTTTSSHLTTTTNNTVTTAS